jgi:hypothetical protein
VDLSTPRPRNCNWAPWATACRRPDMRDCSNQVVPGSYALERASPYSSSDCSGSRISGTTTTETDTSKILGMRESRGRVSGSALNQPPRQWSSGRSYDRVITQIWQHQDRSSNKAIAVALANHAVPESPADCFSLRGYGDLDESTRLEKVVANR